MGNRLRALRKTYGFENLVGKNTALGAKADGAAAATGNKTVNNKSDSAPKRGRPARVKSGTLPASSSTEVATRLEVNVGGDDEEVKSAKRKREDEPTTDVKLENTSEQPQPQPQVKKRGRKPASATTSSASNSVSTSATTPMVMAMPPPASASIPSTGQMNGSGKANSRTVHFDRMREPSKRRKKQEDSSSNTSCNSSSTNRPSEYIYHIAAETIREARRQRRRARRGSVKSKSKSGLKLVFKVARMRSRSW